MRSDTAFYRKNTETGTIEHVYIKLVDEDGEEFDMKTLRDIFKDTLEEQKEKLEKIIDFGTAILGDHHKGVSFMFGWVLQKIIGTYEAKNDIKLKIEIEIEQLDEDEIKENTVEMLEDLLEKIKSGDVDLSDMPIGISGLDSHYE